MEDFLTLEGIGTADGALDGFRMNVSSGCVHALLDECGDTADALIRVLCGEKSCSGRIVLDGEELLLSSRRDALAAGIGGAEGIVQEISLAQNLTLCLGLRGKQLRVETEKYPLLSQDLPLRRRYPELNPVDQVRFVILRSLMRADRIILLPLLPDGLSQQEFRQLYPILDRCARNGRTVVYTTNRLENAAAADEITCAARGRTRCTGPVTQEILRRLREVQPLSADLAQYQKNLLPGGVLISARGLSTKQLSGLNSAILDLREREITGILYAPGSGGDLLAECLRALRRTPIGKVTWPGFSLDRITPGALMSRGLKYIPPLEESLSTPEGWTVLEHVALLRPNSTLLWPGGTLRRDRAGELSLFLLNQFGINASPETPLHELSPRDLRALSVAAVLNADGRVLIAFDLFDMLSEEQILTAASLLHRDRVHSQGILLLSRRLFPLDPLCDRILYLRKGHLYPEIR